MLFQSYKDASGRSIKAGDYVVSFPCLDNLRDKIKDQAFFVEITKILIESHPEAGTYHRIAQLRPSDNPDLPYIAKATSASVEGPYSFDDRNHLRLGWFTGFSRYGLRVDRSMVPKKVLLILDTFPVKE